MTIWTQTRTPLKASHTSRKLEVFLRWHKRRPKDRGDEERLSLKIIKNEAALKEHGQKHPPRERGPGRTLEATWGYDSKWSWWTRKPTYDRTVYFILFYFPFRLICSVFVLFCFVLSFVPCFVFPVFRYFCLQTAKEPVSSSFFLTTTEHASLAASYHQ
jgi:hypothetical protein